ncbi:hypothetical protein [Acinetobacter sp. Marseille-Q1618]|uniref:hypothetical protein n=1 Tax=Acinetobacter sp. Marseille-Q1618 TaxID=2697502 RepID=UPI00156DA80E|nr:hypothetical protein [Acinetobacter sp. Marseille-Q1618]
MNSLNLHQKINRIKNEIIDPQQLGKMSYRLSTHQKFVTWYHSQYESNWFCLNCEKDDETVMDPTTQDVSFEKQNIQCQRCGISDPQGSLVSTKIQDREAWKSAQSIVSHSFDRETIKATEKRSRERFERIQSGETTIEDEETVLLMQWRALNNLLKSQD